MFRIYLTKEEIEDLILNLDQCASEGYMNYRDPAYSAYDKLIKIIENIDARFEA